MEGKDGLGVNGSLMCRQLVTDFCSKRFQGEEHVKAEDGMKGNKTGIKLSE